MKLSGQTIKGYIFGKQIGDTGGFGLVYRAEQPILKREVAIKVILPQYASESDFIKRFDIEAELVARLEHPHITPLYDYWRDPEGAFLVMRLMTGGSLSDSLKKSVLPVDQIANWLDQIASALAFAHRRNVIHRDIKPANILLDAEGNAYLADFGIAKDLQGQTSITNSQVLMTPAYAAPEQFVGEPLTPQTDIYSLGVLLFQLLTGHHPYPNASLSEIVNKTLHEPLPHIKTIRPELSDSFDAVIRQATKKNPIARYTDALALATAFRSAIEPQNAAAVSSPVSAATIIFDNAAQTNSLPHVFNELYQSIRDAQGSIVINPSQVKDFIQHKPANFTEYRLSRVVEWSAPRYQLDNRFVNLTLMIDQGENAQGVRWQAQEQRRFNDLRDILKEFSDNPALVLLGAPGSGKSTLLRRLQLDDAIDRLRDDGEGLTFFIQLNNYRGENSPRDWLNSEWRRCYPNLASLNLLLDNGKLLLLLDALNEMPHRSPADYHERVGRWKAFVQEIVPSGNRVVFSCRSLEYSASLSSSDLRVPQVVVQPLSDEQVQGFLSAYAPARADMIWDGLRGTKHMEVFHVPFFLKLLIDQVKNTPDFPKGKASLFTGYVRGALQREIEGGNSLFLPNGLLNEHDHKKLASNKWRNPFDLPERGFLIPSITALAFQMQEKGLDSDGAQIRIDVDDAYHLLHHDRDKDILKAGVALNVLDEDIAREEILFFHQLLQEFFAARKLVQQFNPTLMKSEWRAEYVQPSLKDIIATLAFSDPLPPLPATAWDETTLMAAVMADNVDTILQALIPVNLSLAARCANEPEISVSHTIKSELQQALIARTQDMKADLRDRIAAGLALGRLGDPRFKHKKGPYGDYLLPPLVTISAGTYPMGNDDSDDAYEKPAHTVELSEYKIGQFPVTVAEYALFIAADGYNDDQWWETEASKAWRKGEGRYKSTAHKWREKRKMLKAYTQEELLDLVEQGRITSEDFENWIIIKSWSDEEFEAWAKERTKEKDRMGPVSWTNSNYNNPSQPVIGVCWYEARAYCKWLSAQTGQLFELPTETQFEAAARGKEGRLYPYGSDFITSRCNTVESHILRTTPVGIFDNATPQGVYDLTGNVFTWTTSIYDLERFPYPYNEHDGREDLTSDTNRMIRGGSWIHDHNFARATYRCDGYVNGPALNIGFRVVCPSSNFEH